MPKGFIMIRKKVGDDEKVLLDLIHHHIIICLHERRDERDKFSLVCAPECLLGPY